jgi:hypothetical protein
MLPALFMATLLVFAVGDESTNPVDVMAAMVSRESGCVTVTEVFALDDPVPHVQFHVLSDPPSGGVLTGTPNRHLLS